MLAVAVTGDLDAARQRQAGESLLGGEDTGEVERLEIEVGGGAVVVVGAELELLVSGVQVEMEERMFFNLPHADPGGLLRHRMQERWVATGC